MSEALKPDKGRVRCVNCDGIGYRWITNYADRQAAKYPHECSACHGSGELEVIRNA